MLRTDLHLVTLVLLWTGCSSAPKPRPAETAADSARITQFYAAAPATAKGDATTLCYGVENALSVRIDPPVESLKPALARCISVSPKETTIYTLTAEGPDKKPVSQTTTVNMVGALPKFTDLEISAKEVGPGELVSFCFKAVNATKVTGGPGRFQSGGSPKADCLTDRPQKTTTYSLKIENADGGTDEDSITVQVR